MNYSTDRHALHSTAEHYTEIIFSFSLTIDMKEIKCFTRLNILRFEGLLIPRTTQTIPTTKVNIRVRDFQILPRPLYTLHILYNINAIKLNFIC